MNNIRAFRKKALLSQTALAEKIGVSQQSITKWENDVAAPRMEMAKKLAEVLGCSIDELFG